MFFVISFLGLVGSVAHGDDGDLDIHYGIRSLPMTAFLTVYSSMDKDAATFDSALTLLGGGVDLLNYKVGRVGRLSLLNISAYALGLSFGQLIAGKDGSHWARFGLVRAGIHIVHMEPFGPAKLKLGFQSGVAMLCGPKNSKDFLGPPGFAFGVELISLTVTWLHDEPKPVQRFENHFEMPTNGTP